MMTPEQREAAAPRLTELGKLAEARTSVDLAIKITVAELRSHAVSWSWIGSALGVSTQAAWERYGDLKAGSSAPDPRQEYLDGFEK